MELPCPIPAKITPSPETVAAVDAGANIVRTIRDSVGYSIEEQALTCGLAVSEIADLESDNDADPIKLRRIAAALRLPKNILLR